MNTVTSTLCSPYSYATWRRRKWTLIFTAPMGEIPTQYTAWLMNLLRYNIMAMHNFPWICCYNFWRNDYLNMITWPSAAECYADRPTRLHKLNLFGNRVHNFIELYIGHVYRKLGERPTNQPFLSRHGELLKRVSHIVEWLPISSIPEVKNSRWWPKNRTTLYFSLYME